MGKVIVFAGLVLLVQGGGGLVNTLFSDSKSWFVLNYLPIPEALRLLGYAVMLVAGLFLVVRRKGWKWLLED